MSVRTVFLARLFGLYCIIMATAMLAQPEAFVTTVNAFVANAPLVLTAGVFTLLGGLALVLLHNRRTSRHMHRLPSTSVSAFGPIVLSSYAEETDGRHAARRDEASAEGSLEKPAQSPGLVIDFLAERIEPAANTETLSQSTLYADYAAWCRAHERTALSAAEFVGEVDKARAENDLGNVIRKRKGGYSGIRLAAAPS